jgi:hypothetical protein
VTRKLLPALAAALALAPAALAHEGGSSLYQSQPKQLQPSLRGAVFKVIDGDDRLWLDNRTGKTVLVLGYQGEPYLRFDSAGVWQNDHSPAVYLNLDRYAKTALPKDANAKLPPKWEKLVASQAFSWHDHRIHWMSTVPPPSVRADPEEPHHVFDWTVPLRVDGRSYKLTGTLDYVPKDSGGSGLPVAAIAGGAGGAVVLLVAAAFFLLRSRRR